MIQTLSSTTVESYVSAIVSLWTQQTACGLHKHPNPRGAKIKAILSNRTKQEAVRRKKEYIDRAIGTVQDAFKGEQCEQIVRCCWTKWASEKVVTSTSLESWLRTSADFLLGFSMLLRGESRRMAELPDLFSLSLKNEGPTPCIALVLIMNNGKTNKGNRTEYGMAVRHKNALLCPLAALAFYLFYRWHVVQEPPPCFAQRQLWYDSHLLKGQTDTKKILSYHTHLEWTNKAFVGANLAHLKKTHAGRKDGALTAEDNGTPESQIRRAGHWNNDVMSTTYLSNFPREFVRGQAGFPPVQPGNYYLPRAKVQPPASLLSAVWPWVDAWQAWFHANLHNLSMDDDPALASYVRSLNLGASDSVHDKKDLAAQGFLRLLVELRTIFLQDSVLFQREFPTHPMWNDQLFVREDYRTFAAQVQRSKEEIETPIELRVRQVLPDVAEEIRLLREVLVRNQNQSADKQFQLSEVTHRRLEDFLDGRTPLALVPQHTLRTTGVSTSPFTLFEHPSTSVGVGRMKVSTAHDPVFPSTQAVRQPEFMADIDPALRPSVLEEPLSIVPSSEAEGECPEATLYSKQPPSYEMSRTITSVLDLWREWTQGLGSGPSIEQLESMYGASWRPSAASRMWFSRRKVIIDEIRRKHNCTPGRNIDVIVREMEAIRVRLGFKGLAPLSDWIKKTRRDPLSVRA